MIQLKSATEIEILRENALILSEILEAVIEASDVGVSTADLDEMARGLIRKAGAKPAFLGYRGYPAAICSSINEEIVHGIPSADRLLSDGDVVSLDIGIERNGLFADKAETFVVGDAPAEALELIGIAQEALHRGIEQVAPGKRVGDISHAIGAYIADRGYGVVKRFVGHGIGRSMHEDPQIPNFGPAGRGAKLMAGMVLAIEPMIWKESGATTGEAAEERVLADGWTVVTPEGQRSAHVEDMVLVTETGHEVLTRSLIRVH